MSIGKRIKEKRLSKNFTLEKLAEYIGVTKSTVLRYENETIAIPSNKIERIAEALNCTPTYLMGWEDTGKELYDIKLENGKLFRFIEKKGQISMLMKEKENWKEFKFNDWEQSEFEKCMGMNMLFFNGKNNISEEDKLNLEKTLLTIFIKAFFNRKK